MPPESTAPLHLTPYAGETDRSDLGQGRQGRVSLWRKQSRGGEPGRALAAVWASSPQLPLPFWLRNLIKEQQKHPHPQHTPLHTPSGLQKAWQPTVCFVCAADRNAQLTGLGKAGGRSAPPMPAVITGYEVFCSPFQRPAPRLSQDESL